MTPCQPIISTLACYVPPRVLTNFDLERMVSTNNEWIVERTGITERHIASPDMATSDMAVAAAKCVLEKRGIPAEDLDVVIVCTVTRICSSRRPPASSRIELAPRKHGAMTSVRPAPASLYGLTSAAALIKSGLHRKVLVIGADTMSRILDYHDRSTCILFGDGAGTMLVEAAEDGQKDFGFIDFIGEIDGSGGDYLKMPAGGSRLPASAETVLARQHYVKQEGQSGVQVCCPKNAGAFPKRFSDATGLRRTTSPS